jgi:hypothetical protein
MRKAEHVYLSATHKTYRDFLKSEINFIRYYQIKLKGDPYLHNMPFLQRRITKPHFRRF